MSDHDDVNTAGGLWRDLPAHRPFKKRKTDRETWCRACGSSLWPCEIARLQAIERAAREYRKAYRGQDADAVVLAQERLWAALATEAEGGER